MRVMRLPLPAIPPYHSQYLCDGIAWWKHGRNAIRGEQLPSCRSCKREVTFTLMKAVAKSISCAGPNSAVEKNGLVTPYCMH